MNQKFILVDDNRTNLIHNILRDAGNDERVIMHPSTIGINSHILKHIRKIHLSQRIDQYCKLPFKYIWSNRFSEINFKQDTIYTIIGVSGTFFPLSPIYLNKLKDKYNIHYALFLVDHYTSPYNKVARYYMSKIEFDYIFSFDFNDANEYGFTYCAAPYSMMQVTIDKPIVYDLCLICSNKGRLDKLLNIHSKSIIHGVNSFFAVSGVPFLQTRKDRSIIYNRFFSYEDVINCVSETNCILDITIDGQSGVSNRYYEAVCYNKKLLTNNRNIVNMPFYNCEYMHIFDQSEDIDWDWVKERAPVDYHYDGRFSPIHLIDKIIEMEEEKERQ